jgi:hypothetical protein
MIGWCNYYKICNNKHPFAKITYWLIKRISKALYLLYIKPSFEQGKYGIRAGKHSGRLRRKLAAQVVKRQHFLKAKDRRNYGFNNLRYNSKRSSIVVSKTSRRKIELFLPAYMERKEQPTTFGRNYFDPSDNLELRIIAFENKASVREDLLKKCRGYCPSCSRDLLNCKYDIHHIIIMGGNNNPRNLTPLCVYCHKKITSAVKSKDQQTINKFSKLGLLNMNINDTQS